MSHAPQVLCGDSLQLLPALATGSVQAIVTSPPYWGLRSYLLDTHPDKLAEIGGEPTPGEYITNLVDVLGLARRVLADDGVLWVNLGDRYATYPANRGAGSGFIRGRARTPDTGPRGLSGDRPNKSLLMLPARLALALQDDGWVLRNDIIWRRTNPVPFSGGDRFANVHEHVLMLVKHPRRYRFHLGAVREPRRGRIRPDGSHPDGRNPGDVWDIATGRSQGGHFAVMPAELARRCILASTRPGETILDPFHGAGTTGRVAGSLGRKYVGIELNEAYIQDESVPDAA